MAFKKIPLTIDTIIRNPVPIEGINQEDNIELNIVVTENKTPKDLSNQTIKVYIRRIDGTLVEQTDQITPTNASKGEITVKLKNSAFNKEGYALFQLDISDSIGRITSSYATFKIGRGLVSGEVIANTNEVEALKKIEEYIKKANQELETFKQTVVEINENEATRQENEAVRIEGEILRGEAEQNREARRKQFEKEINSEITKIKEEISIKNAMSNSFAWEGYKLKAINVGQVIGAGGKSTKYFNKQEIDLTNYSRGVAYFDCSEAEPLKIKLLENFTEYNKEFNDNPNIIIVGFRDFGRRYCNYLANDEILSPKFIVLDNSFYIKNNKVCIDDNAFIIGGGSNWIKVPKNDDGYNLDVGDVLIVNIESGAPIIENWSWNNVIGKQNYNVNSYKSTCVPIAYKDNVGKIHLVAKNDSDIEKIIADITEMKSQIGEITSGKTNWSDKKIVWFGTSIPAGENGKSYPTEIGKLLKANVVNEAWGSSPVRSGQRNKVSEEDTRGWFGLAWQNVAFALSGTLEEKNEIINNWEYWKMKFSNNPPEVLTETMKGYIRDCSYENRLMRHIGDGKRADLYVFDHGFNDFLDGSDLDTVPHDIKDRKTFIGAMNFLIDIILKDNPRARIILIGHYENQFRPLVASTQIKIAESWSLPIYKQWEKLGWSSNKINTTGYWDNGNWIESGGSPTDRKIKDIWLADGVHPHSDKSGRATNHIIKNMLPFFLNIN